MIRLVSMFGTGDTYLVCALVRAFEKHHNLVAKIVCKGAHRYIPELFGFHHDIQDGLSGTFSVSDGLVSDAESNINRQRFYLNEILDGSTYYVHPSYIRSGVRVDQFTFTCRPISQADMYKALLHLPLDTPLDRPSFKLVEQSPGQRVLLIREAKSWPNTQSAFWDKLHGSLVEREYKVLLNQPKWDLKDLFSACAISDWVIGPQCGVMSILCHAQFPCRKSFCTPAERPGISITATMPYAGVRTFAGEDYDVDEFVVSKDNHAEIINRLLSAPTRRRTEPVQTIDAPMSTGDFLDKLAILLVKHSKFDQQNKALLVRELDRYCSILQGLTWQDLQVFLDQLVKIHSDTFDLCASYVPSALRGENDENRHARAIALNKQRVIIRQQIDRLCGAASTETKDYYQ